MHHPHVMLKWLISHTFVLLGVSVKVAGYREEDVVSNKTFVFFFFCQCAGPTYNFKNYCFSKVL